MDYSVMINSASMILFAMACHVFAVNIIVEVIKKSFARIPTTLLTTIVSLAVSLLVFLAWTSIEGFEVCWYHIVGALVFGLFVAYAAMFGFDKFKQAFEKLKSYRN